MVYSIRGDNQVGGRLRIKKQIQNGDIKNGERPKEFPGDCKASKITEGQRSHKEELFHTGRKAPEGMCPGR